MGKKVINQKQKLATKQTNQKTQNTPFSSSSSRLSFIFKEKKIKIQDPSIVKS